MQQPRKACLYAIFSAAVFLGDLSLPLEDVSSAFDEVAWLSSAYAFRLGLVIKRFEQLGKQILSL